MDEKSRFCEECDEIHIEGQTCAANSKSAPARGCVGRREKGKPMTENKLPFKFGKNQRKVMEHLVRRIQRAKKDGNYPGDMRGIMVCMLTLYDIFPGHYEKEILSFINRMVENDMLWERRIGWRLSDMWYDLLIT